MLGEGKINGMCISSGYCLWIFFCVGEIAKNSYDYEKSAKELRHRRLKIILTRIGDCSSEMQKCRWEEGRTVFEGKGDKKRNVH